MAELGRGEVDLAVDLEGRQVGVALPAPPLDGEHAHRTAAEALLPDGEVGFRRAAGAVQRDDPALDPAGGFPGNVGETAVAGRDVERGLRVRSGDEETK